MYRSPYTKGPVIITQRFGAPGNYAAGKHTGIDLVGQTDKTIVSSINGVVAATVYNDKSYGHYIILKETSTGWTFFYAHLSQINVSAKQTISIGHTIGTEGSTGNSTGSHLHLEVESSDWAYNRNLIDPAAVFDFNKFTNTAMAANLVLWSQDHDSWISQHLMTYLACPGMPYDGWNASKYPAARVFKVGGEAASGTLLLSGSNQEQTAKTVLDWIAKN
ncbi:MAG: M23 family metallopeptidase [Peptococcaceae bacterium]|nr:M23 family metallopeptidase [Peptococcaceae bacterium]